LDALFVDASLKKQYNQKYTKGKEGHDWLLRKNIWRRMRYRRENKQIVERMKSSTTKLSSASTSSLWHSELESSTNTANAGDESHHASQTLGESSSNQPFAQSGRDSVATASHSVDEVDNDDAAAATHAAAVAAAAESSDLHFVLADQAAVDAAVAAAETFGHDQAVLAEATAAAVAAAAAATETALVDDSGSANVVTSGMQDLVGSDAMAAEVEMSIQMNAATAIDEYETVDV
jgi:hypothetical protein